MSKYLEEKQTESKSLASEYISRPAFNRSASTSIVSGHDANFRTAYVLESPWSIKATDQASLDDALKIGCRYIAERPEEIDTVRAVLASRKFLAKLSKNLGIEQARLIKRGQPMITLDMLLAAVSDTNENLSIKSRASDLIMTALIGRALTSFGIVQISDGLLEVEIEDGLIPDWSRLKAESIQRELETVFGSVSFDNAIEASQTVGNLLLPQLATLLRQLVNQLEASRTRLLMTDILGAASVVYLQDFANKQTIFNGLLTNETVARMSTNLTFVTQYLATKPTLQSMNTLLACAPSHTVAQGMAAAANGITASGRIKEVDLESFARNTEFLLLRDLNHMPTRLYMAAAYQATDYKPQVSLFETNDGVTSILPLSALEDALAQYVPAILNATSEGVLASFSNQLELIESSRYSARLKDFDDDDHDSVQIAKECCLTSSFFLNDRAVTGLMMTESYLEHVAASIADSIVVKKMYTSDGLCAEGVDEVAELDGSVLTYVTTRRAPDLGDELFTLNQVDFVTQDPAIVVAFGMDLPTYQPAHGKWTVGSQTLPRDMRVKDVIGKVIPPDMAESDEYLVPNPKSTLDRPIVFQLPTEIAEVDGATIEIDIAKSLTGVEYRSMALGKVYAHQLPVLRALNNSTFAFLRDLLLEDSGYEQQIAVAVSSFLKPYLDNPIIHRMVAVGKSEMLLMSETCVERRKLAASLRRGSIDAHMGLHIVFDVLRKMQLLDNELYKQLVENDLLSSTLMMTLISSVFRQKGIQSY